MQSRLICVSCHTAQRLFKLVFLPSVLYTHPNIDPRQFQIEAIYKNAHAAIRKDPSAKPKAKKSVQKKRWTAKKLTREERQGKVKKAKEEFLSQIEAQRD